MRRDGDGRIRDRFVLSTGHSAIGLFAVLGELGVYDSDELAGYGTDGSRIEESPLEGTPGFEITGGSLGQGLSQAVGIALGERLLGADTRVFCLLSDGELQEGQVWEAAMSAAHHRLRSLTVLVDNNGIQADGATAEVMGVEPVVAKFQGFGFDAESVDPHDINALLNGTSGELRASARCWSSRRSRGVASRASRPTTRCITSGRMRESGRPRSMSSKRRHIGPQREDPSDRDAPRRRSVEKLAVCPCNHRRGARRSR